MYQNRYIMSFIKIWIHAVWATKNREPLLAKEIRPKMFEHIHSIGLEKDILIDTVNGHLEHVHCLFRLKNDQTVKKTLQLMKGESSFWINQNHLLNNKFEWQSDYSVKYLCFHTP